MAEIVESSVLIRDVETKNIMTKSTLPVGGYSVNPYVGCTHGCKYCYASFMKRFTGHRVICHFDRSDSIRGRPVFSHRALWLPTPCDTR